MTEQQVLMEMSNTLGQVKANTDTIKGQVNELYTRQNHIETQCAATRESIDGRFAAVDTKVEGLAKRIGTNGKASETLRIPAPPKTTRSIKIGKVEVPVEKGFSVRDFVAIILTVAVVYVALAELGLLPSRSKEQMTQMVETVEKLNGDN